MNSNKMIYFSYFKFFYGIFIIWYGINLLYNEKKEENEKYIPSALDFIHKIQNSTKIDLKLNKMINSLDLSKSCKAHSYEIIYFIGIIFIIGGFVASCGYGESYYFIMIGLILDLIFIHNLSYYKQEPMKINVFKIISLIGGSYFII